MFNLKRKSAMPSATEALPGRATPIPTASKHFLNGHDLKGPYPEGLETAMFGMGWLLGRRAQVLGARRGRLRHGGRLCGRAHPEPDLSGGLHRPYRS